MAFAFTACSDSDNANSVSGITVEMKEATMRVPEDQVSSGTYYEIPIVVNGETNGDVVVTVDFAPVGPSGAVYDENYIVTQNTIIIPAGATEGAIQFYPVGDEVINDHRVFSATIGEVKGATVGANKTTVVTLIDNEGLVPKAYQAIQGNWTATWESLYDGVKTGSVLIYGVNEGEEGFNKTIYVQGIADADVVWKGEMAVDGATEAISINFEIAQIILSANFTNIGPADVKLIWSSKKGFYGSAPYPVEAACDPACTNIKFNFPAINGEETFLAYIIYTGSSPRSYFDQLKSVSIAR